jgi:hypothetical protein
MKPHNVKTSHWWAYNALFFSEHFLGEKLYDRLLGNTEKNILAAIDKYASNNPAKEDFRIIEYKKGEYTEPVMHPYYPIVFRGAAADWPCLKKWSFNYFSEKYGDQDVPLLKSPGMVKKDDAALTEDTPLSYGIVKLRDYIANMQKGSKKYLKFSRIVDEQSSLREDFDYNWLGKFREPGAKNDLNYFFMGGKNTLSPIHADYATTVFVEISGTKKWIFYPINHRLFLGAKSRRYNYFYTDADPYNLTDPKFPLLKYAKPYEVLLHAGDVLYFPSLLWHQVENVTDTIAVSYKYATFKAGFTSSKMLFTCFLLATKPWLIETILPWSKDAIGYKKATI